MLISVCVAAWDVAEWVGRMIESVQAQTWPEWELCIVDDGSTDGTWDVLYRASQLDHRVRVERAEHLGMARAHNRAFGMACGQVICRQDSDDWMMPERLEKQAACLYRGADIVCCHMAVVSEDGKPVGVWTSAGLDEEVYVYEKTRSHGPLDASIMAWARVYDEVGLWNPAYPWSPVSEWIVRSLGFGFRWDAVAEPLYVYRLHPRRTTVRGRGRGEQTYEFLVRKEREWRAHAASRMDG